MRVFDRTNDGVADVYSVNSFGKAVSFRASLDAVSHLRWEPASQARHAAEVEDWARRRRALLDRLRTLPLEMIGVEDFIEAGELGEPRARVILTRKFASARRSAPVWGHQDLTAAAGALLLLDPTHLQSAKTLVGILVGATTPDLVRSFAAATVAGVFRYSLLTPAMMLLRRSLADILYGRGPLSWDSRVYTCLRQFVAIDSAATVLACERELQQADEWSRGMLLNEIAECSSSDLLAMLARHLPSEPSARVRLRIVRILGGLLEHTARLSALSDALADPSPSCRYLAIKALRLGGLASAKGLARQQLAIEPDPVLSALLQQVLDHDGFDHVP